MMTKASRVSEADLEATILAMVEERGVGKTLCPSDAARRLVGDDPEAWSRLMPVVRRLSVALAKAGRLTIYRKGKPVDPDDFRGVYRLGAPQPE